MIGPGLTLLGGICLFLFGVEESSKASRRALGERERALMARFASGSVGALSLGALLSFVSQSSSVATSFAMGLVDIGALSFGSSIVTMMGSSIGASLMTFVLSMDVSLLGPGFVTLGTLWGAVSNPLSRYGPLIRGMGIVLVGMYMIKAGVSPLMEMGGVMDLVGHLAGRPWSLALLAFLATAAFQSSSAVVALGIAMASTGALGLDGAAWLVVGAHGGSFAPVVLASLGKKLSARRLAVATGIYKVIGALMGVFLVGLFTQRLGAMPPQRGIPVFMGFLTVVNGVVMLPLTGLLADLSARLVSGGLAPGETAYIDDALVGFPEVAFKLLEKELARLADLEDRLLGQLAQLAESRDGAVDGPAMDGLVDLADSCVRYLEAIEDPTPEGVERKKWLAKVALCLRSMAQVMTRDLHPAILRLKGVPVPGLGRAMGEVEEIFSASVGAWVLGDRYFAVRALGRYEPISHRGLGLSAGEGAQELFRLMDLERALVELLRGAVDLARMVIEEGS
ncbi:Na+/Picotransporter [Thermanaerovibrio acidaminovorans DSM 6589]|uniref:Na+/Picotransporter n=1 Tax=Thermanaerovibrio acidaminovorans (strain ATCC 49978 / DSM 6589 / Su883) TaxID=525903 RepID=D1B8G4_THEAS|nr:Na/Pi symporter [Thermanaerovibrio acidaminovorans]ACZ18567.1 Na+/Picotransporter [Thermanaerovibrio acidaminovorans DSM 6589]